jgi:acyl dehydratase
LNGRADGQLTKETTPMSSTTTTTLAELPSFKGQVLGTSEWFEVTQERVNTFADATDDHQWIHVDVERAKDSPFGGTIAHGYLTLSLVAPIMGQLVKVTDSSAGINYGLDRVRFPAPIPVGARWRGGAELLEVTEIPNGLQMKVRVTIEVEGTEKPAMVADVLVRLYS